jgi:hypothetical protein
MGRGGRGGAGARWPAMKAVVNGGSYRLRERGNGCEEARGTAGLEEDGGHREEGGERAREKRPERVAAVGEGRAAGGGRRS